MNVSYTVPLRNAWSRMVRMLFRPFGIQVWFVLGFAAFLSEYLSWGFSGSRMGYNRHPHAIPHETLRRAVEFLLNPLAMTALLIFVLCGLVAYVLLLWVSSRGKFIFLENVARERAAIVEPWHRLARLGNSLFVWRLGFVVVCLLAAGALLFPFLATIAALVGANGFRPADLLVLLPLALLALPLGIVFSYTLLFLNSFVVPIMYRHDLSAAAAWGRFLGLFRQRPWAFIAFGLFAFVLTVAAGAALVALGMATCCIGFVLMGMPYIGSVLLLPLEVTARALGPEFLSQFGPDLAVLAPPAAAPRPPAPAAGSGT